VIIAPHARDMTAARAWYAVVRLATRAMPCRYTPAHPGDFRGAEIFAELVAVHGRPDDLSRRANPLSRRIRVTGTAEHG
jgi:hypothetical protein